MRGLRLGIASSLMMSVVAISELFTSHANAVSVTTLLSFNDANGANPYGDLTLIGSTLYGTASKGGANGCGTVFSVPVSGGTPTTPSRLMTPMVISPIAV